MMPYLPQMPGRGTQNEASSPGDDAPESAVGHFRVVVTRRRRARPWEPLLPWTLHPCWGAVGGKVPGADPPARTTDHAWQLLDAARSTGRHWKSDLRPVEGACASRAFRRAVVVLTRWASSIDPGARSARPRSRPSAVLWPDGPRGHQPNRCPGVDRPAVSEATLTVERPASLHDP